MEKKLLLIKVVLLYVMFLGCAGNASSVNVELFRVYEVKLKADSPGNNPYLNGPAVTAKFAGISGEASGKSLIITGFWDGGNIWKLRFTPTSPGQWTYTTSSSDPGLNKKTGTITAVRPTSEQLSSNILYHGFLEKDETYSWKLSDGTPFLPVGETQWCFTEEFLFSEWEQWIDVLQDRNFNTFMGCAWLGKYTRANIYPFQDSDPNSDQLLVSFFQEQLDPMVQYANDHGIMMGIVIGGFPDNSQWFRKFNTITRNDRWFKYIIARYSAFNVRWGLFGEINEAVGRYALEDKSWEWVGSHFSQLIKNNDPYEHPVGSHSTRVDTSSALDPNISFIEVQEGSRIS
ncbi:MAG TPA: DUF5060 domain-containing protein, partial [Anaerovoracaceae bacterium]|nr:DUF5060 domain-containing protein [Anaerovoracaceae bacterium]